MNLISTSLDNQSLNKEYVPPCIPFFNLENNLHSNIAFTIKLQEAINQIITQLLYSREAHFLYEDFRYLRRYLLISLFKI